jgi:hypothetical protein
MHQLGAYCGRLIAPSDSLPLLKGANLMNARWSMSAFAAAAVCLAAASSGWADPLPGEVLKFQQLPLNNGLIPVPAVAPVPLAQPYPGHD